MEKENKRLNRKIDLTPSNLMGLAGIIKNSPPAATGRGSNRTAYPKWIMRPNNEIIPLSGRLGKSYFGGGFYYGGTQKKNDTYIRVI